MSGGNFDYAQFHITTIYESIQSDLDRQGESNNDPFSSGFNTIYSEEIQEKFKEGIKVLKKAYVYAQRIDWYLSGDDSEETFLKRLEEELTKIE